ncbi:39S ribosomal protein L9, mitochondrial isoform X2 [Hemicordylus capensis]|uniref:39S ribosomal protein L9, mitochondrial isoform X2 n=1 Tax=Hemicordylus capensis TaxID=884348 RepID=UPI002303FAA7|nr:39S ribosomal protein L9, mitochondrial isoform X2 [Hemicordylus capensis]
MLLAAAAAAAALRGPLAGLLPPHRGLSLSAPLGTVIVERWWKVPLAKEGRQPRMKHRRYKVYRLVEDTKHSPKQPLELILTENVEDVGNRGDIVSVKKWFGRNHLLARNLAVYASPENKKIYEEEKRLREEGKLPKLQTHTGVKTVRFLQNCCLEIGVNDCKHWELTKEIVARHFLRNLQVMVPLHTLKLPEKPIRELGDYWCEVTVNGLDTVQVAMSVVTSAQPKSSDYREWLTQPKAQPPPDQ